METIILHCKWCNTKTRSNQISMPLLFFIFYWLHLMYFHLRYIIPLVGNDITILFLWENMDDVKIYLCAFYVLKNWKKNVKEYRVTNLRSRKSFGKCNKFCTLVLSTKKWRSILLNVLRMLWIWYLKSMTYPLSRNILKNTMPRYMETHSKIFIFTSCICVGNALLHFISFFPIFLLNFNY